MKFSRSVDINELPDLHQWSLSSRVVVNSGPLALAPSHPTNQPYVDLETRLSGIQDQINALHKSGLAVPLLVEDAWHDATALLKAVKQMGWKLQVLTAHKRNAGERVYLNKGA